jgi:hypothetical protein
VIFELPEILKPLGDLLEFALELDSGHYTADSGNIILYVIRVIVRVEAFMLFLINNHKWDKTSTNNSRASGFVRGLDSTDEYP